jgi:hypothetical protein
MKGFVAMLEMILVAIALFFAFSIFFPGFTYKNRWGDALLVLKGRDIILAADSIGKLYNYSFDSSGFQGFLDRLIPVNETSLLPWSETEGTIKSKIVLACNCTNSQMNNLMSWFSDFKINGRDIETVVCYTNLGVINPCVQTSDAMLIWGYKDLDLFVNQIQDYLSSERGILEIMDFSSAPSGTVQQSIFGLSECTSCTVSTYDSTVKPESVENITYQGWKAYVKGLGGNTTITEFCNETSAKMIKPNGEMGRVLVKGDSASPASCVVMNNYMNISTVAWMSDFISTTYDANHTKLVKVLTLAVSNKRSIGVLSPGLGVGYVTSYVNAINQDMFEVYRFNLGLGYPF